jgi:putative transposase
MQISLRTYQRWSSRQGEIKADGRPQAERPEPANKLSVQERRQILETCNRQAYSSLAPSQIVPALADQGMYIASEASFYRVLRQADQLHRRGKAQAPRTVSKPTGYKAEAPNRVWSEWR